MSTRTNTARPMATLPGGESAQYEGDLQAAPPHKTSTGQFGSSADNTTTDPSKTSEAAQQKAEKGERTAENVRYGQGVSEMGMGGLTDGSVESKGGSTEGEGEGNDARAAAGYDGGSVVGG